MKRHYDNQHYVRGGLEILINNENNPVYETDFGFHDFMASYFFYFFLNFEKRLLSIWYRMLFWLFSDRENEMARQYDNEHTGLKRFCTVFFYQFYTETGDPKGGNSA